MNPCAAARPLGPALACLLALLVLAAIYNGPMNSRFAGRSVPADQVPAMLTIWLTSHAARTALALIASVMSAVAVAR